MVLHRYVLALDVTGFVEALAERGGKGRIRRSGIDECDYRHLRLLRPRRERPCRRATEQRDEIAPFHCRCLRASDRNESTHQLRQETTALRDFGPADDGSGSDSVLGAASG